MGIKSYIVNFLKSLKHGGVKYVSVTFTNPDARYANKKVFISGGSEGLGRAMAKAYLAEGAEVIVTGRSKEKEDPVRCRWCRSSTGISPGEMDE